MRRIWILLLGYVVLSGCGQGVEKAGQQDTPAKATEAARKFFDYDAIDHYVNNYDEAKLSALYDNQSRSIMDSFKAGVVLMDIPIVVPGPSFAESLEQIGYVKKKLDAAKFAAIDSIFMEKPVEEIVATACIYVYRDILIFKKADTIVGVAKVCFECMASHITGARANTEYFGQDGDYERLWKLLQK